MGPYRKFHPMRRIIGIPASIVAMYLLLNAVFAAESPTSNPQQSSLQLPPQVNIKWTCDRGTPARPIAGLFQLKISQQDLVEAELRIQGTVAVTADTARAHCLTREAPFNGALSRDTSTGNEILVIRATLAECGATTITLTKSPGTAHFSGRYATSDPNEKGDARLDL